MENIVSRTLSVHKEHEVLLKIEAAGLTDKLAQKVIDSKGNDLATKVVGLIQNGGFEATTSQKRSREIMGNNFFGVEEAIKHYGVNPTRQQLAVLSEIPFSEAVLEQLRDTHILVAVFPQIYGKAPELFGNHKDAWYNKESFAEEHGKVTWQLVRKTPVENSTSKKWQEQQALITKDDEVPSARVITYVIIGHRLATGARLFENIYVRTSSPSSDVTHILVGHFVQGGLFFDFYLDYLREDYIGLASARKVQS